MQRKPTKNTRGPNADEKRFMAYTKECACVVCGNPGPSIVDHVMGSTYRITKILVGHWLLLPLCYECDELKRRLSRRGFVERFGPFTGYWLNHVANGWIKPPDDVIEAVTGWGK